MMDVVNVYDVVSVDVVVGKMAMAAFLEGELDAEEVDQLVFSVVLEIRAVLAAAGVVVVLYKLGIT